MSQPNGLPSQALGNDTITTHSWAHSSEWAAYPDSKYEIAPAAGKALVLTSVLIRFTEGMIVPEVNKHILEYILDGFAYSPYKITEYKNLRALFSRADEIKRTEYNGTGGDITKPIISLKFDFSIPITLWSSAGVNGGVPNKDKLGQVKFAKLRLRLANNEPYKAENDAQLEMACSRYFATIYTDPDYSP